MNIVIIVRSIAQNHLEFVALVKYFILCSAYSTVTVSLNHTVIILIIVIISVMIYRDMNFLVSPIPISNICKIVVMEEKLDALIKSVDIALKRHRLGTSKICKRGWINWRRTWLWDKKKPHREW